MQSKSSPELYSFDSNCIIDTVEKRPKWWPHLEPIVRDAERGKVVILVSTVSIAECTHVKRFEGRDVDFATGVEQIQKWFDSGYLMVRPPDDRIARIASQWIRDERDGEMKLHTCDALIAATASFYKARALITHDGYKQRTEKHKKLLSLDGKLSHNGTELSIQVPSNDKYSPQSNLFESNP